MSTLFPYKSPTAKPAHKTSMQLAQEAQAAKNKAAAKKTESKKTTTTKSE